MKSMTGFSFYEGQIPGFTYTLDLKSYNNRYLDLILNIPQALSSQEIEIREWLASKIPRGRVEFTVRIRETQAPVQIIPQTEAVNGILQGLLDIKTASGLPGDVTLDHLLRFPEIFKIEKGEIPKDFWQSIEDPRNGLMARFSDTREKEGQRLERDIRNQWLVLFSGLETIRAMSAQMEKVFKENLLKKFEELKTDYDESRLLTEVAVLLTRYGINEELVRLDSHLKSFNEWLSSDQPQGKKLDFLCQEIGREVNTIGSKTTFSEVQHQVVAMKDALENIREQLRNVE